MGWFKGRFTDPATWRDFLYSAIAWPISSVSFVLFTVFWAVGLELSRHCRFWYRFVDDGFLITGESRGPTYVVDSFDDTLIPSVVGFMLLCLAYVATRWVGKVRGLMARRLLGPSRTSMLAAEAAHLQASRARGVDAAEAERRRIERDLHDGAQQRLVAVAMGLGRAKNKMDRILRLRWR